MRTGRADGVRSGVLFHPCRDLCGHSRNPLELALASTTGYAGRVLGMLGGPKYSGTDWGGQGPSEDSRGGSSQPSQAGSLWGLAVGQQLDCLEVRDKWAGLPLPLGRKGFGCVSRSEGGGWPAQRSWGQTNTGLGCAADGTRFCWAVWEGEVKTGLTGRSEDAVLLLPADASPLLSPEPAFSDHMRLGQCPQLQPLPLSHRAQRLRRGRASQLPQGPKL